MKILYILILTFLVNSCSRSQSNLPTIIKGDVSGIGATKIYLLDGYRWKIRLDSSSVKNGKFEFKLKPQIEPSLVSIAYFDEKGFIQKLRFSAGQADNPYAGSKSFVLSPHFVTEISGEYLPSRSSANRSQLTIKGGPQTEYYMAHLGNTIGSIKRIDGMPHNKLANDIKDEIKESPNSFWLLSQIYEYRSIFSSGELSEFVSLFDGEISGIALARDLKYYLDNKPKDGKPIPDLPLVDVTGKTHLSVNKNKKLNMLIFWASWCKPCRDEVPHLKELFGGYRNNDFYVASISIDHIQSAWQDALKVEKMGWDQFIIPAREKEKFNNSYDITAIPLVVFTDQSGKVVKRIEGFSENNIKLYKEQLDAVAENK